MKIFTSKNISNNSKQLLRTARSGFCRDRLVMWLKAFCKILTVTCFLSAVRPVIAIWPDKVYDFYILSGQQGVHWTKKCGRT